MTVDSNSTTWPVIVIAGPTGVGKTDLSIQAAKKFEGEVVNADSMQVYQDLNIGTGKITEEEKQGIPHHLFDRMDAAEIFDASLFQQEAHKTIKKIIKRGKLPIVVGGTGLYLEGLLYDLEFGGSDSFDSDYRLYLNQRLEEEGNQKLWLELQALDPEAVKKIPVQNGRRIIRALEVIHHTGDLFSKQTGHKDKISNYNELLLVLNRPRPELYQRINLRVEGMVEAGLETEVRQLYQRGLDKNLSSMKGIGYKEWWPYFEKLESLDEVIANIQQNSRRYAKRQLTWFRNRMKQPQWIDVSDENYMDRVEKLIENHLRKNKGE